MENEFLQQILCELKEMHGDIDVLKQGQAKLERKIDNMDANINALWRDVNIALDGVVDHVREFHSVG